MRILLTLLLLCFTYPAFAQTQSPIVIIYNNGDNKTDQAFIEMARIGAERAQTELGVEYSEHRLKENENRTSVFERYARNGTKLIIGLGFQNVSTISSLADKYPQTNFTIIDGFIPPIFTNVQSYIFRDNEGAFLVGMVAALHSKTGTIGFIGGMDAPVIRNFAYGYKQGAKYVNPEIKIQQHMIGKTESAFSNPEVAAKLAQEQINNGADIIFAAAGGSSLGAQKTAANYPHVYAIGVDTNQNSNFPGTILTSLVKRVDKAVYTAMKENNLNTWKSGVQYLGIKEGALDYAVDVHNRNLITKSTVDRVEKTKDFIIRGLVNIDVYKENN